MIAPSDFVPEESESCAADDDGDEEDADVEVDDEDAPQRTSRSGARGA